MAFQKGKSGNPNGARKPKVFFEGLMLALKRVPASDQDAKTKLQAIANKLVYLAEEGDLQAIKYIMDRVDGLPVATMDMNVNDRRTAEELPDDELTHIATGGSARTAEAQGSPEKPDSVH